MMSVLVVRGFSARGYRVSVANDDRRWWSALWCVHGVCDRNSVRDRVRIVLAGDGIRRGFILFVVY